MGKLHEVRAFEELPQQILVPALQVGRAGERYEKLFAALVRGNFELASYHWAKIKLTIENGTMKRPARRANADAILRHW